MILRIFDLVPRKLVAGNDYCLLLYLYRKADVEKNTTPSAQFKIFIFLSVMEF